MEERIIPKKPIIYQIMCAGDRQELIIASMKQESQNKSKLSDNLPFLFEYLKVESEVELSRYSKNCIAVVISFDANNNASLAKAKKAQAMLNKQYKYCYFVCHLSNYQDPILLSQAKAFASLQKLIYVDFNRENPAQLVECLYDLASSNYCFHIQNQKMIEEKCLEQAKNVIENKAIMFILVTLDMPKFQDIRLHILKILLYVQAFSEQNTLELDENRRHCLI